MINDLQKKLKKRKRINLKTKDGKDVQVFQSHLKDFSKHIANGNFSELHMQVTEQGVLATYSGPKLSGSITLQNIKDK